MGATRIARRKGSGGGFGFNLGFCGTAKLTVLNYFPFIIS